LDIAPENILFLDDSDVNVEAAKKVNINSIHVKGIHSVRKALIKNGVL
jgi:FMN phosphatase YigB (HAD superfamily)